MGLFGWWIIWEVIFLSFAQPELAMTLLGALGPIVVLMND